MRNVRAWHCWHGTLTKTGEPLPQVLFTGVLDPRGEQTVLALGGSLASSVAEASHLVTDRICRTVKFLCALGRGIPILSLDWLHQVRNLTEDSGQRRKWWEEKGWKHKEFER